jgi:hypothetical protein
MDFLKMMKQAKEMQEQMGSLQGQIEDIEAKALPERAWSPCASTARASSKASQSTRLF